MLGYAPTRITVAFPCAKPQMENANNRTSTRMNFLFIFYPGDISVNYHWQHTALIFLLAPALADLRSSGIGSADNVCQRRVFQDPSCRGAHIEEHLIQRPMFDIAIDQASELLGVTEWRQWTVNQSNDFAQMDLRRRAAQSVPALGATHAFHDAGVFHFQENEFQKFFRQDFLVRDVANLDGPLVVMAGQHHQGL